MSSSESSPRRALLSVYDKTDIVPFARALADMNFQIVSTGGTLKHLEEAGVPVTPVEKVTDFPEMLGGRVKTLHPRIHGGILARRHVADDLKQVAQWDIPLFDVVAVNLYPFRETAARPDVGWEELLENIDIGGPAMVRAAAKNFPHVVVVVDPRRYPFVISALQQNRMTWEERRILAQEAFAHTAAYDDAVARTLAAGPGRFAGEEGDGAVGTGDEDGGEGLPAPRVSMDQGAPVLPQRLTLRLRKWGELRYGENPHQVAAFYVEDGSGAGSLAGGKASLASARQLQGKALSYNNINDAAAALELVGMFKEPAAVAVKHANPCGVAIAGTLAEAFRKARDADPVSIFGGIVALNRPVDEDTAREMAELFLEVIIGPSFTEGARAVLGQKKNLRLLEVDDIGRLSPYWDVRGVRGGLLVQEADVLPSPLRPAGVVTEEAPSPEAWRDLDFAWRVARAVKSNSIVVAKDGQTLGIGAGQMNRILAARIALEHAGEKARGAVLASEAFFPFPDVVQAAAEYGVTAIVQPGGAKRDDESIAACNEAGIAMVFTHTRHFRH